MGDWLSADPAIFKGEHTLLGENLDTGFGEVVTRISASSSVVIPSTERQRVSGLTEDR